MYYVILAWRHYSELLHLLRMEYFWYDREFYVNWKVRYDDMNEGCDDCGVLSLSERNNLGFCLTI